MQTKKQYSLKRETLAKLFWDLRRSKIPNAQNRANLDLWRRIEEEAKKHGFTIRH